MNGTLASDCINLLCNSPFRTVTDLHFNDVSSDWRATIVNRFFPFKVHVCLTPVNNIGSTWRKRNREWILCNDGPHGLQVIRFTFGVDSSNSKFIFFAWFKIITLNITSGRCSYKRPNTSVGIILLHNVVLNWATTVILGWFPCNLASILMNTSDVHWAFWWSGGSNDINSNFCSILAMNIYSMNLVDSIILPCCFINIH